MAALTRYMDTLPEIQPLRITDLSGEARVNAIIACREKYQDYTMPRADMIAAIALAGITFDARGNILLKGI